MRMGRAKKAHWTNKYTQCDLREKNIYSCNGGSNLWNSRRKIRIEIDAISHFERKQKWFWSWSFVSLVLHSYAFVYYVGLLAFFFSLFLLWFYSVHVVNDGKGGIFQQTIMAFIRDPADTIEQKTMNLAFVRNNNMKITHLHVKKKRSGNNNSS